MFHGSLDQDLELRNKVTNLLCYTILYLIYLLYFVRIIIHETASALVYVSNILVNALVYYSNLELYKEFAEQAYSIALHPSGLYILVGFSDKLRLMNLLIDDIRTFKEFTIKGCREVSHLIVC